MKPEVVDAKNVQTQTRQSPAARILESLDGEYYSMRQTAEMCDVHIETLRRLCRTSRVNAPSKATRIGKLVIYLFTPEDVEEVKAYFSGKDRKQTDIEAKVHGNSKTEKVR
jgi:hypothetical protein